MELLLANKAEVNAKNNQSITPLEEAAGSGQKAVGELLLASGANVNATDNYGGTPLHWAAYKGHKDMAELLVAHGAEVNAKENDGKTPLHDSASEGYMAVVELLLAHGADVSAKDIDGETPLDLAAKNGHNDVVELLHGRRPPTLSPMAFSLSAPSHSMRLMGTIGGMIVLCFVFFRSKSSAPGRNWIQRRLPFVGKKHDNAHCSENTNRSSMLPQPASILPTPAIPPQRTRPQGQLVAARTESTSFHKMLLKEIPARHSAKIPSTLRHLRIW